MPTPVESPATLPSRPGAPKAPAAGVPHVRIRPASSWSIPDLREVWDRRELLMNFAVRDVKLRYKQTALGVGWVVLQPLLTSLIFAFVFGLVVRVSTGEVPYILFAYAGFLAWNLFHKVTLQAGSSLIGGAGLLYKVYFPRLILPLSAPAAVLVDFFVSLAVLGGLMAFYGVYPGPGLLLLPVWMVLLLALGLGIGLIASALAVQYRDVNHALPMLMQMLMYLSPVAYPAPMVPERWSSLYYLNPLVSVLEAWRWSLLGTGRLCPGYLAYTAAVSAVMLVVGLLVFKGFERKIADVL